VQSFTGQMPFLTATSRNPCGFTFSAPMTTHNGKGESLLFLHQQCAVQNTDSNSLNA